MRYAPKPTYPEMALMYVRADGIFGGGAYWLLLLGDDRI